MRTLSVGTQEISENVYSFITTKSVHSYITSDHPIRNKSRGHNQKQKTKNKQEHKAPLLFQKVARNIKNPVDCRGVFLVAEDSIRVYVAPKQGA